MGDGEPVSLYKPGSALEAIKECGTQIKLLVAYEQLKLVSMNGSRYHRVWEPAGWHERERDAKIAIVLNVWSRHVSAYRSDVGDMHPEAKQQKLAPFLQRASL